MSTTIKVRPPAPPTAGTKDTRVLQANPLTILRRVLMAAMTGGLPDEYRDDAVNMLTDAMNNPDDEVRGLAVLALHEIGGAAPATLPVFISGLHDPSPIVRRRAARSIGDMSLAALPALAHLAANLSDADEGVRMEVVSAIGRIGPDAQAAIPGLIDLLLHESTRARVIAATTIRRMGSAAVLHMLGLLGDPNPILRERAALLLGQIDVTSDEVVQSLLEACCDREPEVREAARWALERLSGV